MEMSADEFDVLVERALAGLPRELVEQLDNVAVFVEDEPGEPGLLGLYEGIPLTERGDGYAAALPDRVTVYSGPIRRRCRDRDEVVEQVRITVIHELAHHFGIDDDRLHELGYD